MNPNELQDLLCTNIVVCRGVYDANSHVAGGGHHIRLLGLVKQVIFFIQSRAWRAFLGEGLVSSECRHLVVLP